MKVTKASNIAFCPGVDKIIKYIYQCRKGAYLLNSPVHNDIVSNKLIEDGYRIIDTNTLLKCQEITVITQAHGITRIEELIIERNNIHQVDMTCPIIKNIYKHIKENKGPKIAIFGNVNDREVQVITNKFPYVLVLKDKSDLINLKEPYIFLFQSTYPLDKYEEITSYIDNNMVDSKYVDTICPFVRSRFEEAINISSDLILVLSDKKSANGNNLFSVCKKNNPNSTCFLISNMDELKELDLNNYKEATILSATSTPLSFVDEVYNYLLSV